MSKSITVPFINNGVNGRVGRSYAPPKSPSPNAARVEPLVMPTMNFGSVRNSGCGCRNATPAEPLSDGGQRPMTAAEMMAASPSPSDPQPIATRENTHPESSVLRPNFPRSQGASGVQNTSGVEPLVMPRMSFEHRR